jgi:hypothetical protein
MYHDGTLIVEDNDQLCLWTTSLQAFYAFGTFATLLLRVHSTLFHDRITYLLIVLFYCFRILHADDGVGLMAVS